MINFWVLFMAGHCSSGTHAWASELMTLPYQLILELVFMLVNNNHCVIYRRSEQASGIINLLQYV